MILIGQYDSPFVRRTAIVMNHHGIAFERKRLSVFGDFEQMLEHNPLGKVPVLLLDDDEPIYDSRMIIDHIEQTISVENRLLTLEPVARRKVLRVEAIATGLAEKAYERGIEYARRDPDKIDEAWSNRLRKQILSALSWLEALQPDPWLCGDSMSLADITCAVAFTYIREKQQVSLSAGDFPSLDRHCDTCEALAAFKTSAYSASEATSSGWVARPR